MESEWPELRFEELLEIPLRNGIYKKKEFHGSGAQIVNMGELFAYPRLFNVPMKRVELNEKDRKTALLKDGDLLFARRSLTAEGAGKCSIVKEVKEETTFESSLIRARPDKNKAIPDYLYYFFSSPHGKYLIGTILRQVAVSGITGTDLRQLPIPVPPLSVQKSVSDLLGTIDDKITLNHQINTTLESMAQTLFKSWFVDFDPVIDNALAAGNPIPEALKARANARAAPGDQRKPLPDHIREQFPDRFVLTEEMGWVPEGWVITSFGNVSQCFDNKRVPLSKKQREEKKPGDIPYYGATSIMDYVNEWIFDDIYLLLGEDGSVVKDDGTPFTQYIWGKTWVNNHAHVLQGTANVSTEHLLLFMKQQDVRPYVTGAVQQKINQKNLNSIPFLSASGDINRHFHQSIAPLFNKIRGTQEETETLTELRDTLLPKLLSGELRVQEAERQVELAM